MTKKPEYRVVECRGAVFYQNDAFAVGSLEKILQKFSCSQYVLCGGKGQCVTASAGIGAVTLQGGGHGADHAVRLFPARCRVVKINLAFSFFCVSDGAIIFWRAGNGFEKQFARLCSYTVIYAAKLKNCKAAQRRRKNEQYSCGFPFESTDSRLCHAFEVERDQCRGGFHAPRGKRGMRAFRKDRHLRSCAGAQCSGVLQPIRVCRIFPRGK